MTSQENPQFQFTPVSSVIQASFWNKLAELKVNVDKLSETERPIWGYFSNVASTWPTHIMEVDSTSFNSEFDGRTQNIPFYGKILNKNTVEQFKQCDKTELINTEGRILLEILESGEVLEEPGKLNSFFILAFSDLKKYHFYYWFAFPVPYSLPVVLRRKESITDSFSDEQLNVLNEGYQHLDFKQKPYFLVKDNKFYSLRSKLKEITEDNFGEFYFAFSEYSVAGLQPKSQLKNYLILLLHYCPFLGDKNVNFLSFSLDRKLSCKSSLIYRLTLPKLNSNIKDLIYINGPNAWAGWEKNEKNKFAPRLANMRATLDPKVLYEDSVDLNLKLMKWRLLPDIDLDKIKKLRCLLLGAGTLGCSVARTLLGWGVRNITFVDNSTVSFSNPVRQSLYTYEDSVKGELKAKAAPDNLRKIFPGINSEGYNFTIPMPGHTVGDSEIESISKNVEELKNLIEASDVIFLLMDSRESRWLPTLLSIYLKKIVLNVALGFDTYLVMRYGGEENQDEPTEPPSGLIRIPGSELGCYFCNDITAPGDSTKDRTLDQQCTVTRPGVSAIAGALAAELAISIVQHEKGINAPAFYGKRGENDYEGEQSILGLIPHSIRGFLSTFSYVMPATPKYSQCIACSNIVLQEFQNRGMEFLLQVFNGAKYLEEITGIYTSIHERDYSEVLAISDIESD